MEDLPQLSPSEDDYSTSSAMLRVALRVLADAATDDPRDLLWAVQRASNMSFREISSQSGVSLQCVYWHLSRMRRRNSFIDAFLAPVDCRRRRSYDY